MKGREKPGAIGASASAPALRSGSPQSLPGLKRSERQSKRLVKAPERTLLNVAAQRRAKRAGQAEGPRGKEMFHRVKVPVDESAAEYMPYDSITFPKLESGGPREVADAQMDSMWMVGFLDHERQRWVGKAKRKTEGLRQLPGGELPPSAKEEVRNGLATSAPARVSGRRGARGARRHSACVPRPHDHGHPRTAGPLG